MLYFRVLNSAFTFACKRSPGGKQYLCSLSTSRLTPSGANGAGKEATSSKPSVELTDSQVMHLAKLSHLHFTPGTAAFECVKRDTSRLVSAMQNLNGMMKEVKLSSSAHKALSTAHNGASYETDRRNVTDLRVDCVHALVPLHHGQEQADELLGQPEEVLRHASITYQQYFIVPRVVDE